MDKIRVLKREMNTVNQTIINTDPAGGAGDVELPKLC